MCNFPKGTDEKFLQKVIQAFSSHAHFSPAGANEFTVKHYAGDVSYNVDGFCDKNRYETLSLMLETKSGCSSIISILVSNRDMLFNDLIDLATATNSQFIPCLFPEAAQQQDKRRPTTAGFKIKQSIQALVDTLSLCQPHYIRCIKPNDKKKPNDWDNGITTHQVRN